MRRPIGGEIVDRRPLKLPEAPMQVDLEAEEVESLIESLDCLRTKIAFTKGASYAEKTEKIARAAALELKLRQALSSQN